MAAALKRSSHISRLRCESHESRVVPAAQAIGFGAEFTADKLPGGLAAGHAAGNVLRTNGPHQARAAWAPSPADVRWFETSFVFQPGEDDPAANGAKGDGITFTLAASPPPAPNRAGDGLGYAGIGRSVAVRFDLVNNAGEGADSVGLATHGVEPTGPAEASVESFHSGRVFQADIRHDGRGLSAVLTDTVTGLGTAPSRACPQAKSRSEYAAVDMMSMPLDGRADRHHHLTVGLAAECVACAAAEGSGT